MTTTAAPRPDAVYVWAETADSPAVAVAAADGTFSTDTVDVVFTETTAGLSVSLSSPRVGLSRVALRWLEGVPEQALVLGDAWERSYGDLHFEHLRPERVLPWYRLAALPADGGSGHGRATVTRGAGVRVRAGAFCSWTVDSDGVTLWLDVRSGHAPVILGQRVLEAATVVNLETDAGVSTFSAHRELCEALCSDALRMATPLVGCNNWYYAYGTNFDADAVVRDAAMISRVSNNHFVRPFCVIDAGWSKGTTGAPGGPWTEGAGSFADMRQVASRIRKEGARPGVWVRPLLTSDRSSLTRDVMLDSEWPLDPSRPDVLEQVAADIARLREWGYDLIKHDFSTFDILGHFIPGTDAGLSNVPWTFDDRRRTTAEVIVDLYRTIRAAAGDTVIIGCNTVGHLAAGLFEAQRTGDDTSGRQWERTRRMGVNTLAFRLAQHDTFFTLDADCVPSTPATGWSKNAQFLDLIAKSGTALFVSVDPAAHDARVDADLRAAVGLALSGGVQGGVEPLDWEYTSAPRRWRIGETERRYDWNMPWGVDLALASI